MNAKKQPDMKLVAEIATLFEGQSEDIEKAVRCLKVLAHPSRLKIICVLKNGEHSVQDLESYVGVAQATLSQHLSLLKDRGIVTSRRQGNFSLYRIANPDMVNLFEMIEAMFCPKQ